MRTMRIKCILIHISRLLVNTSIELFTNVISVKEFELLGVSHFYNSLPCTEIFAYSYCNLSTFLWPQKFLNESYNISMNEYKNKYGTI